MTDEMRKDANKILDLVNLFHEKYNRPYINIAQHFNSETSWITIRSTDDENFEGITRFENYKGGE